MKGLSVANGRLDGILSAAERNRLAEALFLDLIMKLPRSRCLDDVLVVTADESIARQARWFGHMVLLEDADEGTRRRPRPVRARRWWRVRSGWRCCPSTARCSTSRSSTPASARSPRTALIVPDRHDTGTNALVLAPPDVFLPAFGPDSCARHVSRARAAGISFALEKIESMAIDLDTPEDFGLLRDKLLLDPQPAPRTAEVLWELGDRSQGRGRLATRLSRAGAADQAAHRPARAARGG